MNNTGPQAPPPIGAIAVRCHRDGTVTYYDRLYKKWVERVETIPEYAMAMLPLDWQVRVHRHLWRTLGRRTA